MVVIKLSIITNFFDRKTLEKGENSFISNHVKSFTYENGNILGKVAASMKNKTYDVRVRI